MMMPTAKAALRRRARGQAAVETALVLPFFIFYVMGTIQLSLLHQARLMTKYAAFKAARVGSVHNAKMEPMKKAALAVLLPMAGSGAPGGEHVYKTSSIGDYTLSYNLARMNTQISGTPIVDVTICNPTKAIFTQKNEKFPDFDNPDVAPIEGQDSTKSGHKIKPAPNAEKHWKEAWATRLNVQVTFYHRMVIPFANGMIWWMAMAKENQNVLRLLRMGSEDREKKGEDNKFGDTSKIQAKKTQANGDWTIESLANAARAHVYIMPIRASYGRRMQSNFFPDKAGFELPGSNKCHIPWKKH